MPGGMPHLLKMLSSTVTIVGSHLVRRVPCRGERPVAQSVLNPAPSTQVHPAFARGGAVQARTERRHEVSIDLGG